MSDQATRATDEQRTSAPDGPLAYEPTWYASLLAFSETREVVDERRLVE